jgi:hypothetical protein
MNGGVEEFTDPMGNHGEHPRVATNLWKDKKERRYHLLLRHHAHQHHLAVTQDVLVDWMGPDS